MRPLVPTAKFKRVLRKFVKGNISLQKQVEETLAQMETDIFAPRLGTPKVRR